MKFTLNTALVALGVAFATSLPAQVAADGPGQPNYQPDHKPSTTSYSTMSTSYYKTTSSYYTTTTPYYPSKSPYPSKGSGGGGYDNGYNGKDGKDDYNGKDGYSGKDGYNGKDGGYGVQDKGGYDGKDKSDGYSSSSYGNDNSKGYQVLWGQCGGYYYYGTKKCPPGAYCRYFSDWYSQCNPNNN
ncbi:unnamed protein product [Cyclocybe aegerita]|uniref:CBM1 domain-containing protein n=1 Tax=Cyclocybe aegerita TaxID=1973307 RepID=A0A8S0W7K8_CYCAE|nr:unnamed protein product [Cyclocybe aegerita]